MAKTLADKIREARLIEVKVGEITFQARSATAEEVYRYVQENPELGTGATLADISRRHIIGWAGVKEADLIEGGSEELVPFDKDAFNEIIGDRQEWFTFIGNEVLRKAQDRITQRTGNKKK